ncbi:MAG: hypothetical protein M1313_07900 [Nitrospirae bacterium]|nr:hypothetical protein [Nitrospirota bacterium]
MASYRHLLRTPLLGRFLVPWDLLLPGFWILAGFLFGINLVFLLFFLALSLLGLFWIRKTGEGTIRGRLLYHLRDKIHRVG